MNEKSYELGVMADLWGEARFLHHLFSKIRYEHLWHTHGHVFVLVVFEDGDERTLRYGGGIDHVHILFFSGLPTYANTQPTRLIVCHVVGGVGLAVFLLSWEPYLYIVLAVVHGSRVPGGVSYQTVRDAE